MWASASGKSPTRYRHRHGTIARSGDFVPGAATHHGFRSLSCTSTWHAPYRQDTLEPLQGSLCASDRKTSPPIPPRWSRRDRRTLAPAFIRRTLRGAVHLDVRMTAVASTALTESDAPRSGPAAGRGILRRTHARGTAGGLAVLADDQAVPGGIRRSCASTCRTAWRSSGRGRSRTDLANALEVREMADLQSSPDRPIQLSCVERGDGQPSRTGSRSSSAA